jgi:hypothetical protein
LGPIDHAEKRGDGGLIGRDAVEIAHSKEYQELQAFGYDF